MIVMYQWNSIIHAIGLSAKIKYNQRIRKMILRSQVQGRRLSQKIHLDMIFRGRK